MPLIEVSLINIVKKQVKFKLFSYPSIWLWLVSTQLFGIVLSVAVNNSVNSSDREFMTTINMYDSAFLIIMTFIWIVVATIFHAIATTKQIDFTFITTRLSQFISTILYLVLLAAIGAITAYLGSSLIILILKIIHDGMQFSTQFTFLDHVVNVTGMFGYLLVLSGVAYLAVSLYQLNRFLLPGLLVLYGLVANLSTVYYFENPIIQLFLFFEEETSIILFILKVMGVTGILFVAAWMTTRNREVV